VSTSANVSKYSACVVCVSNVDAVRANIVPLFVVGVHHDAGSERDEERATTRGRGMVVEEAELVMREIWFEIVLKRQWIHWM
jgi:hypothetical protein